MKNFITRCGSLTSVAVITLWCCLAQADDIEVYRGGASGVKPVSIIVIDTSGSMKEPVVLDDPEFEPGTNYKEAYPLDTDGNAINYPFDPNLYYFSDSHNNGSLTSTAIADLIQHPFPPQALKCQAAKSGIESVGSASDEFKRWNTDTQVWDPSIDVQTIVRKYHWWYGWYDDIELTTPDTPIGSTTDTNAIIECKSDEEIHPTGKVLNTDPNITTQYVTTNQKDPNYENTWDNNFRYIHSGNLLNYKIYTDYYTVERIQSRMKITQDAAKYVVNKMSGIKLGLARFDTHTYDADGGFIHVAVDDIASIRQDFTTAIDSYVPWGGTPLSETYYETARYLRGDNVFYGNNSSVQLRRAGREVVYYSGTSAYYDNNASNTYNQSFPSINTSRSGNTYTSPITSACQRTSNIVLFTDGAPTGDDNANSRIRKLLTDANITFNTIPTLTNSDRAVLTNNCSGDGGCAEELAYYLSHVDQRPDLAGLQTINTHIIGGFFDEDSKAADIKRMEDIVKYGQGTFATATNKTEISEAFENALSSGFDSPVSFVAPAVSVNSYTSLEHLDNLFYAMYVPSANSSWKGNLKYYRLSPSGLVVDAEGDPAIDESSGLFKEATRSYWSPEGTTDGDSVLKGGAAVNLIKENNIFTHLGSTKESLNTTLSTSTISKDMLGLPNTSTDVEHADVIDWLNRKQGNGTRLQMEDPLHSRPVVVNYGYTTNPTTNNITPNGVVFVGTNSGYLHAFKADKTNFKEYFSYIPKELLGNANLYRTADQYAPKAYGVDGPINYWHKDENQDSQVNNGEKVYLFFGLRRGGRHYYALDISDPEKPKFQWQITGGQDGDFDKMGESWSPMTLAKVRWGDSGKTKVVLLFGGGYDPAEDNRTTRAPHSMGNSVYMIDPETGALLWSASSGDASTNLTNMTSAITSEVKNIDFDGDQITDYFFVSDLGGRVWRFDLNSKAEAIGESNFIEGAGMIFDANKNSTDYQRFYNAPSVSYFSNAETKEKFLSIAIGSGFRAHPLQVAGRDSFYIIKDNNISAMPATYETLERTDFLDIPSTRLSTAFSPKGWKHDLPTSEKVLSSPLTTNGYMYFTTFSPSPGGANLNTCNADIGSSKAYAINFDPSYPSITSETVDAQGILPEPVEITVTPQGQKEFCLDNPSHESCQPEEEDEDCEDTNSCPPPKPECEASVSVILSGTSVIAGGSDQCELLQRNFWRSL
jgi:type IV pilus assembly protein PilY1